MTSPEFFAAALVFGNIVLIESLLSIDNAAVLAAMVKHLPEEQSKKALKWGMAGAFIFRGLALLLVNVLMKVIWLKIAGGAYLLYLAFDFFKKQWGAVEQADEQEEEAKPSKFAGWVQGAIGGLWGTIAMVEIMDLAFSIDNVFAAVALTKNMVVVIIAVCIGILAMRFVAQRFVGLMRKYPFLEKVTFGVIALLGIKLVVSGALDYMGDSAFKAIWNSHLFDMLFSLAIVVIFAVPVLVSRARAKKTERVILHG